MPSKPLKPCSHPGCPELTNNRHCQAHTKAERVRYDQRRGSSTERGYDGRWRKARETYLRRNPLCVICEKETRLTPATVVDHIIPHRGNQELFWDTTNNWQALCKRCHDIKTATEDGRWTGARATLYDSTLQRVCIPLTVIAGPPGSGKTTYAKEHMGSNDILIGLDVIMSEISGSSMHQAGKEYLDRAIAIRNDILRSLARPSRYSKAWLISSSPQISQRQFYRDKLGALETIVMEVDPVECKNRLRNDTARTRYLSEFISGVDKWWTEYQRSPLDTVITQG